LFGKDANASLLFMKKDRCGQREGWGVRKARKDLGNHHITRKGRGGGRIWLLCEKRRKRGGTFVRRKGHTSVRRIEVGDKGLGKENPNRKGAEKKKKRRGGH